MHDASKSEPSCLWQLVENSLDACEAVKQLPDIEITLHEIDKGQLDKHEACPELALCVSAPLPSC